SPGRASPPRSVTSIDILTINPPHYASVPSIHVTSKLALVICLFSELLWSAFACTLMTEPAFTRRVFIDAGGVAGPCPKRVEVEQADEEVCLVPSTTILSPSFAIRLSFANVNLAEAVTPVACGTVHDFSVCQLRPIVWSGMGSVSFFAFPGLI